MVKFFGELYLVEDVVCQLTCIEEKQKVTRKLLQTKRKISFGNFGDDSKEVLERRLQDLRVDLNYILVYEFHHNYDDRPNRFLLALP